MKKRVIKVLSAFILVFSFLLTGCISAGDPGAFQEPSADIQGASDNANDIMKTANNVTYYYENLIDLNNDKGLEAIDRNAVASCFSAAYLFIDPGSDQEYMDHFSGATQPFYRLVDREIDILAQALYQLIYKMYITNNTSAGPSSNVITGTSFNYNNIANIVIPTEKVVTTNNLEIIDATTEYEDEEKTIISKKGSNEVTSSIFDLRNIATYEIIANVYNETEDSTTKLNVENFYVDSVSVEGTKADGGKATVSVPINNYMVNLNKAVFGGYALESVTSVTVGAIPYTVPCVNFSTSTLNTAYEWEFVDNYSTSPDDSDLKTKLTNELKYRIAAAVAGKEMDEKYDSTKYTELIKTIDHTGFTKQDQNNIVKQILDNTIGTDIVEIDDEFVNKINEHFSITGRPSLSIDSSDLIEKLFISETGEVDGGKYAFQNYKAYRLIIEELVEQATKITGTVFGETESQTLVPGFPRLQVMVVDPRIFMDAVGYEEENDEEVDDYEDIDPDEIPTDTEGTEFTKKLLQSINLKSVLFLPKQLYGERTIAKKDGEEWVVDEDGEQVYDTFIVEGFVVTDVDVVLLADEGNNSVVQGNYTTKITKNDASGTEKTVIQQKQSEAFEVGNELPDPTVEESYCSTTFLEIDGTELMAKQEDEPMSDTDLTTTHDLRMQGYDGLMITELGLVVDMSSEEPQAVSTVTQSTMGLYKVFTFSLDMYKYITVDSVVGEGAGYSLNIDEFAGGNYVLADFSTLQVNDDESVRECKYNILYLSCETT